MNFHQFPLDYFFTLDFFFFLVAFFLEEPLPLAALFLPAKISPQLSEYFFVAPLCRTVTSLPHNSRLTGNRA